MQKQIDKLLNQLKAIKPMVTAKDRAYASSKLRVSYPTVHNYLAGKGTNSDTAYDLLVVFNECIEKRSQVC